MDPTNAQDYLMIGTQQTGQTGVVQGEEEDTPEPDVTPSTTAVFSHPFVAGSEDTSSLDCGSADLDFVSVVSVCVRGCEFRCVM